MDKPKTSKLPEHSAHIFILPLQWDVVKEGKYKEYADGRYDISLAERLDMSKVHSAISKSQWERLAPIDTAPSLEYRDYEKGNSEFEQAEARLLYSESCFFYNHIRRIIYNTQNDDAFVMVLRRKMEGSGKYIVNGYIHKNNPADNKTIAVPKTYELELDDIMLRIYANGIMLLSFHCHNNEYDSLADIATINCWGRRLYAPYSIIDKPYIPPDIPSEIRLELYSGEGNGASTSISLYKEKDIFHAERLSFLKNLLAEEFISKASFTQLSKIRKLNEESYIVLDSFNDDRMYVHSYVCNEKLAKNLQAYYPQRGCNHGPEYKEYIKPTLQNWYALIFGDRDPNDPTCKSAERLTQELSVATYDRWMEYGTFYGLTYNAFLTLMSSRHPTLFNSLWHYFQLSCIALLYKTSLQRFNDEVSGIARLWGKKRARNLSALYKEHFRFINLAWFRDVTAQHQGRELFHMLCEAQQIDQETELLNATLTEMHSDSRMTAEEKRERWHIVFGVLATAYLFVDITGMLSKQELVDLMQSHPLLINMIPIVQHAKRIHVAILFVGIFIVSLICWLFSKIRERKNRH